MANASLDENSQASLTGVLNSTGASAVRVLSDAATHALRVSDGTSGSDNGPRGYAHHDGNGRPTLLAVSSVNATVNGITYVQGVTPVAIYSDSSGNLLVDHT